MAVVNIITKAVYRWISGCNAGILNPGILTICANLKSRDWRRPNSEISGFYKLAKIVLFQLLNDTNKIF